MRFCAWLVWRAARSRGARADQHAALVESGALAGASAKGRARSITIAWASTSG